ncbi:hypothetical protein NONO_c60200 [Nocardia nova SH22a]|uniref:Uncharacterized protein n=1 Tax=Nocardia nova SH22a TaxID=1415166 RepID=W5TUB7_9NOCA|nr:hypothetical protein [Nocardia nova]AHH20796.1 hypothetical protein NONO_c60200 [Nocardia nova SH22a]
MSDNDSRDQLAKYCMDFADNVAWASTGEEAAKHIETVLGWQPPPRRIETAEELDALQPKADIGVVPALIRCDDNFVFERATDLLTAAGRTVWYRPGSSLQRYSDELAYPVTVLIEPGQVSL